MRTDHHATTGACILDPPFGAAVAPPVALRVTATRWRCPIDPDDFEELSEGSTITFITQGGPLGADERILRVAPRLRHREGASLRGRPRQGSRTQRGGT
ncbi:MAG: hypothetical protein HIU57_04205 [Acidobacteria bacterium]|nr:hypothetical protein [Acidobacteriota bacterium]